MKLKILQVGNGWAPDHAGGLNRYFTNLFMALLNKSVSESSAVVLGPAMGAPLEVKTVSQQDGPSLKRLPAIWLQVLRSMRCSDIVVPHFALNILLPALVPRRFRPPFVFQFHGPWAGESTAAGASTKSAAVKKLVENLVYRRCEHFIVLSDAFAEVLANDYGVDSKRITRVLPGVDTNAFNPSKSLKATSPRTVACARRLVPRMGIDVLIRAFAKVDSDAILEIAGSGQSNDDLRVLAADLGISDRIKFCGHITDEELQSLYARATLSVVPTRDLEGFGLVVLESLASGTPVVASEVQGLSEVIKPFSANLLVKPGDVDALASLLQTALSEDSILPSPADCRTYASQFSWSSTAEEVTKVYQSIIRA